MTFWRKPLLEELKIYDFTSYVLNPAGFSENFKLAIKFESSNNPKTAAMFYLRAAQINDKPNDFKKMQSLVKTAELIESYGPMRAFTKLILSVAISSFPQFVEPYNLLLSLEKK